MNVLVTGAAGFIGHAIAARFCARGDHVTCLDDFSSGSRDNLRGLSPLAIIEGCATSQASVAEAVRNADLILHLASIVGMIRVSRDPARAARVSTESTRLLLNAAPGIPFVLFSSSAVYGLSDSGICEESTPLTGEMSLAYDGGQVGYASGKWQAEQIALAAAPTGPVLIVRPFNVVGAGQTGDYGMVIPRFVDKGLRGAPIEIYGDGNQSRSFSHIDTFLDCLMRLIDRWRAGSAASAIYNIGTPNTTTINDLASEVEAALARKLERRHVPFDTVFPGKKDVRARMPGTRKLEDIVGHVAWPSIRDVVREVVADRMAKLAAAGQP